MVVQPSWLEASSHRNRLGRASPHPIHSLLRAHMYRKRKSSKSGRTARRARGLRPLLHSTRIEALEDRRMLAVLTIAQENALPGTPQ